MNVMKNFLVPAICSTLFALTACNDQGSSTTKDMDSSAATPAPAAAENMTMQKTLTLSGAQEVPANNSTATGTADVSYDKGTHMLKYTINWKGLTGDATMAHIHGTAPKGENAGVKRDLSTYLQKDESGSFTDSVMVDGATIKEDSLLSGFYYFNIHTAKHPGGEIRAQIEL